MTCQQFSKRKFHCWRKREALHKMQLLVTYPTKSSNKWDQWSQFSRDWYVPLPFSTFLLQTKFPHGTSVVPFIAVIFRNPDDCRQFIPAVGKKVGPMVTVSENMVTFVPATHIFQTLSGTIPTFKRRIIPLRVQSTFYPHGVKTTAFR